MAKVLVIEDDDQIRIILREVLEEEGYDVVEARDGREGVRSYLESSPDLVITDMVMPQKDGIQTIADLQGISPEVKIIAISGGDRLGPEPYLAIAEGFGAAAVFTKPFSIRELLEAVKKALEKPGSDLLI